MLGGRNNRTDDMFRELEQAFVRAERGGGGDVDVDLRGHTVTVGRRSTGKASKPVCYDIGSLGAMKAYLGIPDLPGPAEGEMNYRQLSRALGTNGSTNEALRALRQEIMGQCERGGVPTVGGVRLDAGLRRFRATVGLYFGPRSPAQVRALLADPARWLGFDGSPTPERTRAEVTPAVPVR